MNYFGWVHRRDGDEALRNDLMKKTQDHADLFVKVMELTEENQSLKREINIIKKERVPIPVGVADPTPSEPSKRKTYVSQVAGFHNNIMANKMLMLISDARESLERFDSTIGPNGQPLTDFARSEFDLILRGTINAYWQLYNWGESMVNEQLSYQLPEKSKDEPSDYYKDREIEDS